MNETWILNEVFFSRGIKEVNFWFSCVLKKDYLSMQNLIKLVSSFNYSSASILKFDFGKWSQYLLIDFKTLLKKKNNVFHSKHKLGFWFPQMRLSCNINCQILPLATFVLASKEQIAAGVWKFAYILLKFIYFEKATKFLRNLHRRVVLFCKSQI